MCVLAVLPAPALGATTSISIKRVFYVAAPGEVNNLAVSLSGTDHVLTDSGATVDAGPGCSTSGNTATCPASGIIGLTVSGGDGADSLTNNTSTPSTLSGGDGNDSLEGGFANDTLRGNQGVDSLSGRAGDDFIDVRGDRSDIVTCGTGDDTVRADGADLVASDCETLDRGGAPPPPPPTSAASPTAGALLGPVETGTLDKGACAMDRLGTPDDDRIDGTALGDNLFGLQGSDVLNRKGARRLPLRRRRDPTACPAARATTACSVTTRTARFRATIGSSGTPEMTCWSEGRAGIGCAAAPDATGCVAAWVTTVSTPSTAGATGSTAVAA